MKYTNKFNLPEPVAAAIRNDSYKKVGDISATGLIRPPQMRVLEKIHDHEIEEDVSDSIWRLLGQSVHAVLERAASAEHLSEERMTVDVFGWKVSGQPDLLDGAGVLSDYKVTSVFSFLLGEKPEWEQQLNIYAWMYWKHSFKVKKLEIVAILRDWKSSEAMRDPEYPQTACLKVDIPLWPFEKTQAYVEERVKLHQEAEALPAEELPECTPHERWSRPTTWALKKPEGKRALAVFDSEEEAKVANTQDRFKGALLEVRPGENIRCERFCRASKWCNQFLGEKK